MVQKKSSDIKKIEEMIEVMKDNDLVELEIKHGVEKIKLRFTERPIVAGIGMGNQAASAGQVPHGQVSQEEVKVDDGLIEIKSPIVGTYYSSPSPDSEPYLEIGSHVNSQSVVCIIEAMKVMNEIKAEVNGTIAQILVSNGEAIEYDQVLFKVKPD